MRDGNAIAKPSEKRRTIYLRFAELDWLDWGAETRFPDGTSVPAVPHDTLDYHHLAHEYGHAGDVLAYCQFRELAHHVMAEGFGSHSLTLFALAHGERASPMITAAEQALAMCLHRYVTKNEHPFVDGLNWPLLRRRFLELIDG